MDLGDLLSGNIIEPPPDDRPVDTSGKPCPTYAIARLSSGLAVECPVVYGGMMGRDRRYRVIAELDWSTAKVVSIEVDRWPPDCFITLKVPESWDDERCREFGHGIDWRTAGQSYTPSRMERHPD
jgi:hypothetical protein